MYIIDIVYIGPTELKSTYRKNIYKVEINCTDYVHNSYPEFF